MSESIQDRWPDFLIIGAPKAGTTYLFNALAGSEQVFVPGNKEPRYFAKSIDPSSFFVPCVTETDAYLRLFLAAQPEQLAGEASPIYLMDPMAPAEIYRHCPSVRMIAVLRNPVDRAYSAFLYHNQRMGRHADFLAAIQQAAREPELSDYGTSYLLEPGFYARQLRRFLDQFPREQLLILDFEQLRQSAEKTLAKVAEHLGIRPPPLPAAHRQRNPYSIPRGRLSGAILRNRTLRGLARKILPAYWSRKVANQVLIRPGEKPQMPDRARHLLVEIYQQDQQELSQLLGWTPDWADFQS